MLSSLLAHADDDPQTAALLREGGEAFVSQSLRPYLVSALLDRDPAQPAIVVAGDDRAARDLAAGLRTWLDPRVVRYYPSRGVNYESHLAPPPHLVGLRIAALDALLEWQTAPGDVAPVVVVSAVALSEKVPDPSMRPHGFVLRTGELIDLDETAMDLVAAGYERVDQVEDRGQFAIRGGLLDVFPATEDRAVRVDLFGDEIEALRWFSTFTQRSLDDADCVEVAPAAELALEHRELAEIAALEDASERPDITELLPVENFHSFLELTSADATVLVSRVRGRRPGARRPLAGRHRRLPRRGRPPPLRRARRDRRPARGARPHPPVEHRPGPALRLPRPGRRHRRPRSERGRARAREAGPLGLPDHSHLRSQGRGGAVCLQPRPPQDALAG